MKITRMSLLLNLAAALMLFCVTAHAQYGDQQQTTDKTKTVTGCLAKGDSPNEFYLTGDDGKKYELRSDKVSLGDHVGHKITVTGNTVKESAEEEKGEAKHAEGAENVAADLQVTNVKMVSTSCK